MELKDSFDGSDDILADQSPDITNRGGAKCWRGERFKLLPVSDFVVAADISGDHSHSCCKHQPSLPNWSRGIPVQFCDSLRDVDEIFASA